MPNADTKPRQDAKPASPSNSPDMQHPNPTLQKANLAPFVLRKNKKKKLIDRAG